MLRPRSSPNATCPDRPGCEPLIQVLLADKSDPSASWIQLKTLSLPIKTQVLPRLRMDTQRGFRLGELAERSTWCVLSGWRSFPKRSLKRSHEVGARQGGLDGRRELKNTRLRPMAGGVFLISAILTPAGVRWRPSIQCSLQGHPRSLTFDQWRRLYGHLEPADWSRETSSFGPDSSLTMAIAL